MWLLQKQYRPISQCKKLYFKSGPMYVVGVDELEDAVEASPQATPLTTALDNHATNNSSPTYDIAIQVGDPLSGEKEVEVEPGSSTVAGKSNVNGEAEPPHRQIPLALAVVPLDISSPNSKLLEEENSTAPPVDLLNNGASAAPRPASPGPFEVLTFEAIAYR